MSNDYCSVHYVTDAEYRCERELIPGRMCLAAAEFAVGLMDGESHALYADVLAYACGQHLSQVIRDLLFENAEEVEQEDVSCRECGREVPATWRVKVSDTWLCGMCLEHGGYAGGYANGARHHAEGRVDSNGRAVIHEPPTADLLPPLADADCG